MCALALFTPCHSTAFVHPHRVPARARASRRKRYSVRSRECIAQRGELSQLARACGIRSVRAAVCVRRYRARAVPLCRRRVQCARRVAPCGIRDGRSLRPSIPVERDNLQRPDHFQLWWTAVLKRARAPLSRALPVAGFTPVRTRVCESNARSPLLHGVS